MARASKEKSRQGDSQAVTEATASSAANALRAAAAAGAGSGKAGAAATVSQLAAICEEAVNHMAQAQTAMFEGKQGGETAIDHLDAALHCLNALADTGERKKAAGTRAAKSA